MHDQPTTVADEADVIVVGAGPGGSATAYHMARHGLRVLLLKGASPAVLQPSRVAPLSRAVLPAWLHASRPSAKAAAALTAVRSAAPRARCCASS